MPRCKRCSVVGWPTRCRPFKFMYRLITCPETAHLELIEYDETPFGLVIAACSRFRPACQPNCPRTCAARLDRRDGATLQIDIREDTDVTVR